MRISSSAWSFIASLLLATRFIGAPAEHPRGLVLDDRTGAPVDFAEVRIQRAGQRGMAAEVRTDAAGIFEARLLPKGEYRIEVVKSNYLPAVEVGPFGYHDTVIRLIKFGIIAGRVLGQNGKAIRSGVVLAMSEPAPGMPLMACGPSCPGAVATVNSGGEYRLYDLPPGKYSVAVRYLDPVLGPGVQYFPNSNVPASFPIAGGEEYTGVDFSAVPAALHTLSGKIETASQTTTSAFALSLTPVGQPGIAMSQTRSTNGQFTLRGIPDGLYDVWVEPAGQSSAGAPEADASDARLFGRLSVGVFGQDVTGVVVSVQPSRAVSFVMSPRSSRSCTTRPVVAALTALEEWRLTPPSRIELGPAPVPKRLGPGLYKVSIPEVGSSCVLLGEPVLDVREAGTGPVELLLVPRGSLMGRAVGSTATPPGNYVAVLVPSDQRGTGFLVYSAILDEHFHFSFPDLPPGRYKILVEPDAERGRHRWAEDLAAMTEITLEAGSPTEVELPIGRKAP
jgi:hypothetical protein